MRFCQEHWDALREAIDAHCLSHLIAPDREVAMKQMADQIQRGERGENPVTPVNYDPLMAAHWAIVSNVMSAIGPGGLYLMGDGPEDPVTEFAAGEGRTWPRCPLCYLNLAHELTCTHPECTMDRNHGYDFWIERAAADQAKNVRALAELG